MFSLIKGAGLDFPESSALKAESIFSVPFDLTGLKTFLRFTSAEFDHNHGI